MKQKLYIDAGLKDYIPIYLGKRLKEVSLMNSLVEIGGYTDIKRLGHNLKGSAASFGFVEIGIIGANIELAALEENGESIKGFASKIGDYINNLDIEYVD